MSHSSKWTFKDKGFLLCKLQLTAFNSHLLTPDFSALEMILIIIFFSPCSLCSKPNSWNAGQLGRWVEWNKPKPGITWQTHRAAPSSWRLARVANRTPSSWPQLGCSLPFPGADLTPVVRLWHAVRRGTLFKTKIYFTVVCRSSFEDSFRPSNCVPFEYLFLIFSHKNRDKIFSLASKHTNWGNSRIVVSHVLSRFLHYLFIV